MREQKDGKWKFKKKVVWRIAIRRIWRQRKYKLWYIIHIQLKSSRIAGECRTFRLIRMHVKVADVSVESYERPSTIDSEYLTLYNALGTKVQHPYILLSYTIHSGANRWLEAHKIFLFFIKNVPNMCQTFRNCYHHVRKKVVIGMDTYGCRAQK